MTDGRGSTTQLAIAGFCLAMFSIALPALVSSQLALMSVLDPARAERAADQIATSRFTADVIEQTVERAVAPIAGADIASQLAIATSSDPRVTGVISSSLMGAHRTIVDPDARSVPDGNVAVRTAITQSVLDTATTAGFDPASVGIDPTNLDALDLDAVAEQAGLPSVVPTSVPRLGLQQVAETTRIIAAIAALIFGFVAVIAMLSGAAPWVAMIGPVVGLGWRRAMSGKVNCNHGSMRGKLVKDGAPGLPGSTKPMDQLWLSD